MKILVVGAGSIGRRHIKNLNFLGYGDIDVVDIDNENLNFVKTNLETKNTFINLKDALNKDYDVGFILTPPIYHIAMALELAKKEMDLFIEKPLSHSLKNVNELIRLKEKNKIVIMVGYNQRFNVGLRKLKNYRDKRIGEIYYIRAEVGQYLPDWRRWQDYRKSYTANRDLGGGIILDGSHEIDYVMWLANSKVSDIKATYCKVSDLEVNAEDMAEAVLRFENGIIGSIHLNMVERGYNRYCKVIGEKGNIKWIFKDNILEFYDGKSKKLKIEKYKFGSNDSYLDELKHFFNCIKNRSEPLSNIYTANEALKMVLRIKGRS